MSATQQLTKRFFIIQVISGREQNVKDVLLQRSKEAGLEEKIGEILIPTEKIMEMRGGKKVHSRRKFYPGYIIVEMIMDDDSWYLVHNLPNVIKFIGGQKPTPLTDKDIDTILRRVKEGSEKEKPKILYETGEIVRVIDGPFADFNGVVEEVNYDKHRLRVAVLIFGRSTPVELEFSQVEKG